MSTIVEKPVEDQDQAGEGPTLEASLYGGYLVRCEDCGRTAVEIIDEYQTEAGHLAVRLPERQHRCECQEVTDDPERVCIRLFRCPACGLGSMTFDQLPLDEVICQHCDEVLRVVRQMEPPIAAHYGPYNISQCTFAA